MGYQQNERWGEEAFGPDFPFCRTHSEHHACTTRRHSTRLPIPRPVRVVTSGRLQSDRAASSNKQASSIKAATSTGVSPLVSNMKRSARIAAKPKQASENGARPGDNDGGQHDYHQAIAWCYALVDEDNREKQLREVLKIERFKGMLGDIPADYKDQAYKNASSHWSKQRNGNTDLSRNAIARAKRLIKEHEAAVLRGAKTIDVRITKMDGSFEFIPAVRCPDGSYRTTAAARVQVGAEEQNAAPPVGGNNDGESEVFRLRRELEVAKTMLLENGLKEDFLDRLQQQQQQQQQQQGRMPNGEEFGEEDDDDDDDDEEEDQQQIDDQTKSVSELQVELAVLREQHATLRAQVQRLEDQQVRAGGGDSGSGEEEKKEQEWI